jgi:hypothetical protein
MVGEMRVTRDYYSIVKSFLNAPGLHIRSMLIDITNVSRKGMAVPHPTTLFMSSFNKNQLLRRENKLTESQNVKSKNQKI